MNAPATQDIDSGKSGDDQIVTPGTPVEHTDILDGQSAGHHVEPEHNEGATGNEPPPADTGAPPTGKQVPINEPPPKTTLEEIYGKAKSGRAAEIEGELADMDAEQKKNYDRMVAEAGGDTPDPFAKDYSDEAMAGLPSDDAQPANNLPAGIDPAAEMTTITVYGMQEQVPTAEVQAGGGIEQFQKMRAADVRLQRLTTYEASLRGWEDRLSERAATLERGDQPPAHDGTGITESSPTDALGDTADIDALSAVLTDAVYSGDREETAKQFASVLSSVRTDAIRAAQASAGSPGPSGPAPADVSAEALARKEANAVFQNEFPDLDTPVLRQAALNMVGVVAKDPVMSGRPLAEITREACSRIVADVFPGQARPGVIPANPAPAGAVIPAVPAVPGTPASDLGARHNLKRRTVVRPLNEAHGRQVPVVADEKPFLSNKEFVAQVRSSRGQPA